MAVKDINIEVFGLTAPASPHLGSRIDLMTVKLLPRHFRGIRSQASKEASEEGEPEGAGPRSSGETRRF